MNQLIIPGNWSKLVYCDKDKDCKGKFGNTITKCLADVELGKGVCVPKNCQDISDCPEIGYVCTTGALKTRECSDENQCEYRPHIVIADCFNMTGN